MNIRLRTLCLGLLVFLLDTASKYWVKTTPWLHDYPVIDGFFTIQYATNEGIAFGFFHDAQSPWKTPLLAVMAVVAIGMVLYYIWSTSTKERLVFVSLGLLLGGILGNFVDRLLHQSVVDFLKVHWGARYVWPTFNFADSAITTGVLMILLASFLNASSEHDQEAEKDSVAVE